MLQADCVSIFVLLLQKTKLMKRNFRWWLLLLLPIDALIVFVVAISLFDFTPKPMEAAEVISGRKSDPVVPDTFSVISWNIGYGGLGSSMDFFYDGGKMVRTGKQQTTIWFEAIGNWLRNHDSTDFILLQEVDFKAKRSYKMPQDRLLADVLHHHHAVRTVNYDVLFVPVPVTAPMGYVKAGMMTFSRNRPSASFRHAYPSIAGWPERLFLLDRCFLETRHTLPGGKELVLLNTHNSAFVDDQQLMLQELEVIREKMNTETLAGNVVVAGGDWNMNPPGFKPDETYAGHRFVSLPVSIPEGFFGNGWKIVSDNRVPSNRHLDQAYTKGTTGSTTIDFFIVSDMLEVIAHEVIDLGFENSDHNPVRISLRLNTH